MNGHGRKYNMGSRFFKGDSRSEKRANNVLGVISGGEGGSRRFRSQKLAEVEKYLRGTQYDHLMNWDTAAEQEEHVPISQRKPKVVFPFAQVFADRLAAKLAGDAAFPKLKIEDDPEAEYFLNSVLIPAAFIKPKVLDAARDLAVYRATMIRYRMIDGSVRLESYNPNYCYPVFKANGELESVVVKYVYTDHSEIDPRTKRAVEKWFKLELTETSDILYDNPRYEAQAESEPIFEVVERNDHGLGFVQAEWITDGDGYGIDSEKEPFVCQIKGFIDALNYNLSQTQQSTSYGLEPQLVIKGMDEDEVDNLIKSSSKGWLLGRQGEAAFLEAQGSGLDKAKETREDFFKRVQDIARIVLLDPEKMVGNAQSAKAMEVMHGPLVELVSEIRPWLEKGLISLCQKIMTTIVLVRNSGFEVDFVMPSGWTPKSLEITAIWPPIFPLTTQDKQQLVSLGIQVSGANIVSRDTIGKWLQAQGVDFGVEDWNLERQKVDAQKQFGGFF